MIKTAARILALSIIALLAAALPAHSQSNIHVVRMHVPMLALAREAQTEVQQAADGEIIWTQQLVAARGARLLLPFQMEQPWERARFRIDVPQNEILFEVRFHNNRRAAFCTSSATWSNFANGEFHAAYRTCFADDDQDGQFDAVLNLVETANYDASQAFDIAELPGAGFGGTTLLRFPTSPVGYEPTTVLEPPTSTIAIQLKGNRLVLVAVVPGARSLMVEGRRVRGSYIETTTRASLPSSRRLPATVSILGAEVEIVSRDADGIRYRVVRGFSQQAIDVSLHPF